MKSFLIFCESRSIDILPVNRQSLTLCCVEMAKTGKSVQTIENTVKSVNFLSNFFGCRMSLSENCIKYLLKFIAKVCLKTSNAKDAFQSKDILQLYRRIIEEGGLSSLSFVELRTFAMLVFSNQTLCRFSDCHVIKLTDLEYSVDFFKVKIQQSKTDQEGLGQHVILPNKSGELNPLVTFCLYLHALDINCSTEKDLYIFPPMKRDKKSKKWVPKEKSRLSYSAAYSCYKNLLKKYNFDCSRFGTHSLRSGGTTDCFQSKLPSRFIDRQGRWKSKSTKYRYARDELKVFVKELKKVEM